ncbi:hypothetical protein EA462_01450 [Natrarchaeobius halalkaliphilus]|uniref:Thaumarchaeal output domain-containing protein n=1 Tax=Natrarchaeobius halalkaliphilus TaxID=1679091 RepID=A0A3N6P9J9_9EURY|nr:hypothetical protein [Natrarchaeobius halalkaliphilus]RQG92915.1 hypothetical protein EA462_01450 [Natrarchaeobius halalkaliphilus]
MSRLQDGTHDAFDPVIDETGDVSYPPVEHHLDQRDGKAIDFLRAMADRGVLSSEFEYKVYVCPDCSAEGMQYTTGCPHCESVHATREAAVVHPVCGETLGTDPRADADNTVEGQDEERADGQESLYCQNCDEELPPEDLKRDHQYRCHGCNAGFDSPTHRLWCWDCRHTCPPTDAREQPLYRYRLTATGDRWVVEQVDGRRSLAETFEARGYETAVDTTVPTSSGDERSVHVYAEDDLLDDRIVAGVHDSPTPADVEHLVEAARETDARPVILSTDGAADERAAELLDAESVTVVRATGGELSRVHGISERSRGDNRVLEWLGSFVPSSASRR